jgi:AsmA protein
MTKKLLIAGAAIAGLLVVSALGLFLFLDANQFRPQLEQAMGAALGRTVAVGNIEVALFSGGIAVDDLSIADDPAFSTAPFVTARAVTVGVDLMALVFSRSLRVESFRLEEPQVVLLTSPSGQWNFSGLGAAATTAGAPSTMAGGSAAAMSVVVRKIEIANGRILIGTPGTRGKERVYDSVNLEVSDLSIASRFPFRLTAGTPGGGTVSLDGQAGPFNTSDVADTPFQTTLEVRGVDVASTGFVDPASGLAGAIDFTGTLGSRGGQLTSKGTATATGLQLVAGGAPSRVPIEIDYESDYSRQARTGVVTQGDVRIGKAVAHLTGDYTGSGETFAVRMKLSGDGMPAPDLEAALPAIGFTLPSGASLRQGTLGVNLTISGPVDRLVIAGPIDLSNVTVAGFDLGGKLGALPALGGVSKSGDTVIQTLAATLRIAPEGIRADGLNLVAPAIGTLTGDGTIAPKGDLNFTMLAKLTGSAASQVSRVTSLGQPASGIPFKIQGTMANPIFVPDVGRAVGDLARDPETAKKAASALRGLFGGKKQ